MIQAHVDLFVKEVKECHFFSFDTESKGNLPRKDGLPDRLFCTMSGPKTGTILMFHDCLDIPDDIIALFKDYAIAKIQSGIANDVELFDNLGIDVYGLVDSGCLFLLIEPESAAYGAGRQLEVLYPGRNSHVPYPVWQMPEDLEREHLRPKCRRHVIQDVLTPYATLYTAAIRRAARLRYRAQDDIMPLIQEALEICYSREPREAHAHTDKKKKSDLNEFDPPMNY